MLQIYQDDDKLFKKYIHEHPLYNRQRVSPMSSPKELLASNNPKP